ncbi:KICSTOR complex protein kaptin [Diabrotica virgifera virgifera]|uniref:KICSTOR complex protein kaptin-like n=1 Tax=Diabrotica virgifera virgifera TaxID=50390 RepID=A0A6P7GIL5_DIAVI|nr:KICSTOR complex protein kaptin [Diabrotica virgifera virgifera]
MENYKDVHFFHTTSQGNIYTMVELPLPNGSTKLLVASLKREIFCYEFQESPSGSLIPSSKEVSFTYIPNGAEIISMDAFNRSTTGIEFVIGITIIKNSSDAEGRLDTYLNIYSGEETEELNIENIAQSCLNVELSFIPYKLLHMYLVTFDEDKIVNKEVVFVLSGSDNQIHIFRENNEEHNYKEIDNQEYFPEFTKTPSPVIWIDVYYTEDFSERITTFACECGYVKLLKIDVKTNKVVYNFSTRFGNYIAKVHISPEKDPPPEGLKLLKKTGSRDKRLNLVVVNTILPCMIFHDVLEYGLSNYSTLPRLSSITMLSCCEVDDIDFDGKKEILVGTNSEEILLYKRDSENIWWLEELKKVTGPVLGIKCIDMTGDGVKDLVIQSMKGVQVLQHDQHFLQKILQSKIDNLTVPSISELKVE